MDEKHWKLRGKVIGGAGLKSRSRLLLPSLISTQNLKSEVANFFYFRSNQQN